MPSITGTYVIRRALRLFGELGQGRQVDQPELADGLEVLNDLVSQWRANSLTIPYEAVSQYSLVSSQQTYSLGPGGDFDQARPTFIRGIGLVLLEPDIPTELPLALISAQYWPMVTQKTQQSTYPTFCYPQMAAPLIALNFWPVPTQANDIRIYYPAVMSSFATPDTSYDVPEGYPMALIYALARLLAPEYGMTLTPEQIETADQAMVTIASVNVNTDVLRVDSALRGGQASYNWRTDSPQGFGGPL